MRLLRAIASVLFAIAKGIAAGIAVLALILCAVIYFPRAFEIFLITCSLTAVAGVVLLFALAVSDAYDKQ